MIGMENVTQTLANLGDLEQSAGILLDDTIQNDPLLAFNGDAVRSPPYEVGQIMSELGKGFCADVSRRSQRPALLRTALFDEYQLTREFLLKASCELDQQLEMTAFAKVEDCLITDRRFDLVVYHCHAAPGLETALSRIRSVAPEIPTLVMSDADDEKHASAALLALKCGARGYIPTRTTGIAMLSAAIHVVTAGGTFVPLELLLATKSDVPAVEIANPPQLNRLTSRQQAVLNLLQKGKANKIIAHELRMSESTVKVHVRNVLRKMGATNRTQAAYNAQRM